MRDISRKIETFRIAEATADVTMKPESIKAINENTTTKKDVLATARAASYLAIKNTSSVIPLCHPIPVEDVDTNFSIEEDSIRIDVMVKTNYKTGCEMEALHGASIAALTIYDMVKPIDKTIEINNIRLVSKTGGKSDYMDKYPEGLKAAVIVISDSVSSGKKEDKAGKVIQEKLASINIDTEEYIIIPDEPKQIQEQVEALCNKGIDLVIATGGTGLSLRDQTPEALEEILDTTIPGIMEAARSYGQKRTPYAMLSRSIAGLKGRTLVLGLPGSTRGAAETMDALFPYVLHIFHVLEKSYAHEDIRNS